MARTLGQTLDELRVAAGLSKARLARDMPVDRAQVIRWLRDESQPRPQNVRRLADLLGVEQTWLMRVAGYLSEHPGAEDGDELDPDLVTLVRVWGELPPGRKEAIKVLAGQGGGRFSFWYPPENAAELLAFVRRLTSQPILGTS